MLESQFVRNWAKAILRLFSTYSCHKLNITGIRISSFTIFVVTKDIISISLALWTLEMCTTQSTIISSEKYLTIWKLLSVFTFFYIFKQNQNFWVRFWVPHMTRLGPKHFQKIQKLIYSVNHANKWSNSIKILKSRFFSIKMCIFDQNHHLGYGVGSY